MQSTRMVCCSVVLAASCGPAAKPPVTGDPARPPAAAAAAPAAAAQAPAQPIAAPQPPELRLPATVQPRRYAVELTLDPASEDFTGTITSELAIAAPTDVVWLHGDEIQIDKAQFVVGGRAIEARALPAVNTFIGLVPASPLAPGEARLVIAYRGKMHRNDGDGIYTAKEGEAWYAFTQFEATDARQAFPCFDEPSFKVPWKLAIRTKKELVALSNTPAESERDEGNGMKLVQFAETRPLPSYLIALAVGPFDFVDAGKTRGGAPIRIVVPRGRGGDAAYAARTTRPLVDLLEDWFGSPYPYPKLDMVAVPVFNAGAMENAGLITYRQQILLIKPEDMTRDRQKSFAVVATHEIAHHWFGNYVTLAWWDDIWLNEAFATWMEGKVLDRWKPEWDIAVDDIGEKGWAMSEDSLDSARAIRQPIKTSDDIESAFDGITYQKGKAVLMMLERWIGADKFQQGVRAYLAQHAWGNATYQDFVGAITRVAGPDVQKLFDAFVLQSGLPEVSFELACAAGAPPRLKLAQRRYAPAGSRIDQKRTWPVPVCVRWGAGAARGRDCTLLSEPAGELALTAKSCPDWVLPNEAELGYYRAAPGRDLLDNLLARASRVLTLAERVGLIGDIRAQVVAGTLDNGFALGLVDSLARDSSHHLVDASVGLIAGIDELVPDDLRPAYERLIARLYRARAGELGWAAKRGEDDNTKQLRPTLLALVAGDGRDAAMIKQATALAWKWLDDRKAIDPELVRVVLAVASRYGDQKLFDRMHAEARKTTDRTERARLLSAMGAFTDPAILKQALTIAIGDEFELREGLGLLQGGFQDRRTREISFAFFRDNYDAISNKLPVMYRPHMVFVLVSLCDDGRKAELEALFRPRIEKLEGGPRALEQALEALSLCSAQRKKNAPGVIAFLRKQ